MRCKNCDYALWNLNERTCPECGTSFKPSEFEFVPGNVVYKCPHCAQEYVGTGEHGHLEPPQFDCTQCGERISMDEMALRIGDDLADRDTRPGLMPWLERRHRGRLKAFFQTIGMALVRPQHLIRGVPQDASVGESLVFGFTTTLLLLGSGLLLTIVPWVLGFQGPLSRLTGGGMGGLGAWIMLIWSIMYTLLALFITLSLLIFWPMVIHATLRLTGGCRHGIDRTFQAFGYSAGANALSTVPCVGIWIGLIWWMVSATLMIRAGQRVSAVRAALSVLALPLLVGGIWLGVVGLSVYAQNQLATVAGAPGFGGGFNTAQQQTMVVNSSLTSSLWQNPSRTYPTHISELLLTNPTLVMPGSTGFTDPSTNTTPADVPIGSTTLAKFSSMPRAQQLAEITAQLQAVPANVIAHRFGDFVLTYHGYAVPGGMGFANDPNLWMVVMLADPDANGLPATNDTVHIAFGNQMITTTTYKQLTADLKKQNAHRATLGLAPLPDLATVTHGSPAVNATTTP